MGDIKGDLKKLGVRNLWLVARRIEKTLQNPLKRLFSFWSIEPMMINIFKLTVCKSSNINKYNKIILIFRRRNLQMFFE